jgi:hypothetical protein
MRFFILITIITLLPRCQNSSSKTQVPKKDDTTKTQPDMAKTIPVVKKDTAPYTVPDEIPVNEMLKAGYGTEWHVLNDEEAKWIKGIFDHFILTKRKANPSYPYIARGDFNADGKQDVAAVVANSTKENFQIAIVLAPDNIQLWKEDIMINAAISSIPKSTIEGMDGEKIKKIKLKGDGINVEYFEKASFVLYWDKGSFKRIQTAD